MMNETYYYLDFECDIYIYIYTCVCVCVCDKNVFRDFLFNHHQDNIDI